MQQYHPQVKEYFWNFIDAVDKYERLKNSGTKEQPDPLIDLIRSGMRIWSNQLSSELSRAFAVLYVNCVIKHEPDLMYEIATQMAVDLKDNFALVHMKYDDKTVETVDGTP